MNTIFAYVKIFEKENYAEDFLSGKLFMNTIRYFKEYKDSNGELRGDDHEGIVSIYQPEKLGELKLGGISISPEDLAAPIVLHGNEVLNKNAFCIYSLNSGGHESLSRDTLSDFRRTLEVHETCYGLGSYCVGVLNVTEFKKRCVKAVKTLNVAGKMGLVEYFNEHEFHGNFPKEKYGFHKRNMFSKQRECRVLIDIHKEDPGPFTLEIGDISDICTLIITPEEFNSQLELKLPDGSRA